MIEITAVSAGRFIPWEQDKFKFDKAGLKLEFVPDENKMILKQAGQVFDLKKEP